MRLDRARLAKIVSVALISTLFGGMGSVDLSRANPPYPISSSTTVTLEPDVPTVAPVAALSASAGANVGTVSFCLAYYNNGFHPSRIGPISNTVTLTSSMQDVLLTFPAPPSGKAYLVYKCSVGNQGGTLWERTPITGTSYLVKNAGTAGDGELNSYGVPNNYIIPLQENGLFPMPPATGSAQYKVTSMMGISMAPNKPKEICYTEADRQTNRAIPLVDGQSIQFATSNRNVVDFSPSGTPGTVGPFGNQPLVAPATTSVVVAGGKACVQVVSKSIGLASVGPVVGQTYQTYMADTTTSIYNYSACAGLQYADPVTRKVTCTVQAALIQSSTISVESALIVTPSSQNLSISPTNGSGTITLTSPDGIPNGLLFSLGFFGGTNVIGNIKTPFPLTSGGTTSLTVTANGTVGTGTYFAAPSGFGGYSTTTFTISAGFNAPTGVTAAPSSTSPTEAVVSFTAPVNNSGSTITGYTVTAYDSSGSTPISPAITATGTGTSIPISGLVPGTTYTFKVAVNYGNGGTALSTATNTVAIAANRLPGAPGTPTVTVNKMSATNPTTDFSVAFTPPADLGSPALTSYTAQLYINNQPTAIKVTGTSSPITVSLPTGVNPTPGPYMFKVFATNGAGDGPASSPSNYTDVQFPGGYGAGYVKNTYTHSAMVSGTVNPADGIVKVQFALYPAGTTVASGTPIATSEFYPPATECALGSTLAPLTNYVFFTRYFNGFGSTDWQGPTSFTTLREPPVAPVYSGTNYYVGTPGVGSIALTWPAATGTVTSYRIHTIFTADNPIYSDDWNTYTDSSTAITFGNLDPKGGYTFEIYASNEDAESINSVNQNATNTPIRPYGPPVAPTITGVTGSPTSAVVTFTPLVQNIAQTSGLAVTSYDATVYLNGVATGITASGTSSPLTLTGLTTGVTYQIDVRATTSAGTSPLNLSANYTPVTPPAPAAPTGVTVSPTSTANQVSVAFTAPTIPAYSSLVNYVVTATGSYGTPITVSGSSSPILVSNLPQSGSPYTFTVAAVSTSGTGASSTPSLPYTMPTVPSAPVLTSVGIGANVHSGNIVFSTPLSDGGSAIESYTVKVYPTPSTGYGAANASQSVLTFTISGATGGTKTVTLPGSDYQYETLTVTANNLVGSSPESNAMPLIPGQPGSFVSVVRGDGQLTVTPGLPAQAAWPQTIRVTAFDRDDTTTAVSGTTGPNHILDVYNYREDTTLGASHFNIGPLVNEDTYGFNYTAPSCTVTLPARTCTITGLVNGHSYDMLARAYNASGGSYFGAMIDPPYTPFSSATLAPTGVNAIGGNTQAQVWWDVPGLGGTNPGETVTVTNYTVTAYASSGETLTATTSTRGTAGTPYIFTGLTNGKTYTFVVSANALVAGGSLNGQTVSSAGSIPSNAVLVATTPGKPATPTVVYNQSSANVTFTAPTTGGSPITGYTFVATPIGGGTTLTQSTALLASPYVFTGLDLTKTYTFKLKATNDMGDGAFSDAGTAATSVLVIRPGAVTVPFGTSSVGYTAGYSVAGETVDPTMNNSGWVAPTCSATPAYTSTTAVGVYANAISCSGATRGSLYSSITYQTETLTVTNSALSPTNVTATLANGSASVAFTPSPGATSYTVTAYVNGVATTLTATGTSSPITISGLTPGLNYSFSVTATNGGGTSIGSIPSVPAVMPKTVLYVIPDPLTITEGSPSVTYTWKIERTAYDTTTVVNGAVGNTGWVAPTCSISPAYTQTTTAGLKTITCSGGNGGSLYTLDYGYTSSLNVAASMAIPGSPTGVAVTASGATGATVSFTAPTIATPALSNYTVTAIPVGGGTPITTTVTAPASSASVSGLTPGTTYNFQVVANNSAGSSSPVGASLTVAGSAPSNNIGGGGGGGGGYVAPAVTIPTAPTAVTATLGGTAGSNYAIVYFTPAATNGVTTSYTVTAQPGGITASGTGSPIRINGLTPGVNYTFTVTATNSAGTSSSSASSGAFVIPSSTTNSSTSFVEVPPSVAPGTSAVTVGGTGVVVPLTRNVANSTLNFTAKDWTLSVNAYAETGKLNPVSASLSLTGVQGGIVTAKGTGFAPNSAVAVYMFSKVYTLGTHAADSNGGFDVTDTVPMDLTPGEHTIQVVGYAPGGKIRSASLKITVVAASAVKPVVTPTPKPTLTSTATPDVPTEPTAYNSASTKIFFNLNASFVDAKAIATIKKFVAAVKKKHAGPYKISVVGVVEPTPVNPFPVAVLSKARAVALAAKLKAAGLVGKYSIKGGGLADKKGPSSRYAKVTVTWVA